MCFQEGYPVALGRMGVLSGVGQGAGCEDSRELFISDLSIYSLV